MPAHTARIQGLLSYTQLNTSSPIATALLSAGIRVHLRRRARRPDQRADRRHIRPEQSSFAMSRDGLLPPVFSALHQNFETPFVDTIIIGGDISLIAAFLPVEFIAQMASIGTLCALAAVAVGVIVLRRTQPDLRRPSRVPWVPVLPAVSALYSVYLMLSLPLATWIRFLVWILVGLVIYYFYGYRHSRLTVPGQTQTHK